MSRWLFTIVSALSLVLCGWLAVLWGQSYHAPRRMFYKAKVKFDAKVNSMPFAGFESGVLSRDGSLTFFNKRTEWQPVSKPAPAKPVIWPINFGVVRLVFTRIDEVGDFDGSTANIELEEHDVIVPYSVPVVGSGILPPACAMMWCFLACRSYRKRVARRRGCCVVCGYDLRATRDRCPECGTPVTSIAGAPA